MKKLLLLLSLAFPVSVVEANAFNETYDMKCESGLGMLNLANVDPGIDELLRHIYLEGDNTTNSSVEENSAVISRFKSH